MKKQKANPKDKHIVTIEIPVKKTARVPDDVDYLEYGETRMYRNGSNPDNGMFFANPKRGREIDPKDMMVLTKEARLMFGVLRPDAESQFCFEVSIPELEALVKGAKQRQRKFKDKKYPGICFMNLSPDVSMMVRLRKPRPKKAK